MVLKTNTTHWPVGKQHQVVWDSLINYGILEWQRTLRDLKKVLDDAYDDFLREFDKVWCVKGLIVTHTNLVVTWKVNRPRMGIIS